MTCNKRKTNKLALTNEAYLYCIRVCACIHMRMCVYSYAYTRIGLTRITRIFWFGHIWAALYVLSWLRFNFLSLQNPFPAPNFKCGIFLQRFGFLQILTCSISFLCRDQATSGAQEKLQTQGGACKNLSLSRHSSVNDLIKSAKCVGLGPRTTNTFYMSVWQPRNPLSASNTLLFLETSEYWS